LQNPTLELSQPHINASAGTAPACLFLLAPENPGTQVRFMKFEFRRMLGQWFDFGNPSEKPEARKANPPELRNIVVLGAGTMGNQIAVQCAGHGHDVTLYDVDSAIPSRAKDQVAGILY
jgi:phosphoglycerate dehydrogenase-like enzyme